MATENSLFKPAFYLAGEDLSSDQYRFVIASATAGDVRRPDTEAETSIGVLQNAPEDNEPAEVMVHGITKVRGNGALTVGMFVRPEYVGAADAGKAKDAGTGTNRQYSRGLVIEASGAEDDLATILLIGPQSPFPDRCGLNAGTLTVTTDATAGANTWTAAELLGGLCLRDPAGADRSDVTPTATLIVAAIDNCAAGDFFEFTIRNTADANETITLTAGDDITLSGNMTIPWNTEKRFLCLITDASTEAATIYSIGEYKGAGPVMGKSVVTTDTTSGNNTWSGAEMLGGILLRDPVGADRDDVTDTGTNIAAALTDAGVGANMTGTSFEFTIRNTADANETITLTAGSSVTLSGNMVIPWNTTKRFICVMTAATTCTIYAIADSAEPGGVPLIGRTVVDTDSTAGANTYTAAELLGGLILRDCAGGARTDVTPTGTEIAAALVDAGVSAGNIVGSSFEFTIVNTSDDAETITLSGGDDVTTVNLQTIAENNCKRFICVMTAATECSIYGLGTAAVLA